MSSSPRRLLRPDPPCIRWTLNAAEAFVKSSLAKDPHALPFQSVKVLPGQSLKDHLLFAFTFAKGAANPTSPGTSLREGLGLTAGDTVSRCFSTPTASPLWRDRRSFQAVLPYALQSLPPTADRHHSLAFAMALLKPNSALASRLFESQATTLHTASSPSLDLQERLRTQPSIAYPFAHREVLWAGGRSLSLKNKGQVDSSQGETWGLKATASLGSNRPSSSHRAQDQKQNRALGPLLSHHALKAASSFHYLHGGLADVAAFTHHAPLDGRLKFRGPHDARVDHTGATLCIASDTEAAPADEASGEKQVADAVTDSKLRLVSGACALPHPDKTEKGGEDAYFISSSCQAVGVADGVGGWADVGVDAGEYARELMSEALKAVEGEVVISGGHADPMDVLQTAHANTGSQGSSTACVILLCDQKLSAANLGDSGFMVIRSGRTIFKSPPQQHDFNFPYQLGSAGGDPPTHAEVYSLPVAPGDVIVLGTDGLFDNVFDGELASMVMHSLMSGRSPQSTAEHIAALARVRAADRVRFSPFARAAMEAGYRYYGGKMDDITVVVSYVTSGGNAK